MVSKCYKDGALSRFWLKGSNAVGYLNRPGVKLHPGDMLTVVQHHYSPARLELADKACIIPSKRTSKSLTLAPHGNSATVFVLLPLPIGAPYNSGVL